MAGHTNKLKYNILNWVYEGQEASIPATFYFEMYTSDFAFTADTNTNADVTNCPAGNGYTVGGNACAPATGFDSLTEDDANDRASVQVVDQTWTASGGAIPTSGNALYYCALVDNNATTESREVYNYWGLGANRTVSDGQAITIQDAEIRINEA